MRPTADLDAVLALIDAGLNDCEIARRTGIPRSTIRDWRHGRGCGPFRTFRSDHDHDFSALPASEYAYLLGIYLGDGCISRHPRTWALRIFTDARYPLIIDECSRAMETLMPGKRAHRWLRRDSACVAIAMYSNHWPCLLPQHGPGRKHLRTIELEMWQKRLVDHAHESLLRGLIHSDGCRCVAVERKREYVRFAPRYLFSNRSEDIKRIFCSSLNALEIPWTRPSDKTIAVYRKAAVARMDEFIGPKE